jgi:hypothetical protein
MAKKSSAVERGERNGLEAVAASLPFGPEWNRSIRCANTQTLGIASQARYSTMQSTVDKDRGARSKR